MIDFSKVQELVIPEGVVAQIDIDGVKMWTNSLFNYVSLGDSIAAGHTINADWETDYGEGSQYGKNGNTSTTIVPNSYTHLIQNRLAETYGGNRISTKSFAHSGDTVEDLMKKLSHTVVVNAIKKADLVTICIGANDVLQPALHHLDEYINTGDLSVLATIVEQNLAILNDDSESNSYMALFKRLNEINPNAQIVFTTIYNPYKYLHIEEGQNGFFKPVLDTIPDMNMFGFDVDGLIKDMLLDADYVELLFDRVNGLSAWAEEYVTKLNTVLRNKINEYQSTNSNFKLAETKTLFESFPNRTVTASKHYNDLVSVEFTRGFDVSNADWGKLYEGTDAGTFWLDLATRYVSLSGLDIGGLVNELMPQIVEKVLMPDVDPHPEEWGHYVLMRSFADTIGWEALDRYTITFNANGASGSMTSQAVVGVDSLPAFVNINALAFTPATGYRFVNWNTTASGSGTSYSNGQEIGVTGNMNLYAQWSNMCTVTYRHSYDSALHSSSDTGPMENYALWIDGVEQSDLGAFSNSARTYNLPYGTQIGVIAQTNSGDARSYITFNGTKVAGTSSDARYTFTLTSNADINFEWNYWIESLIYPQSYWNCYITG